MSAPGKKPSGPLAGIRVIDASQGGVGPWSGVILGMLGADVIKLESPQGDFIRAVMPAKRGLSATYISMNSCKRAITLDMKKPEDRAEAHQLAAMADVFIENFRPGVADRIGIGFAELAKLNPRLVYASASGFGPVGPLVPMGATDPHVQAFTGSTAVNGKPGGARQRWRWYGHFDCTTALVIAQSILSALHERNRTGRGQHLEITMVEAALALQRVRLSEHLAGGKIGPMGSATTYLVPDQAFATQDHPVAVSATSARQWRALCTAIGRPELATDPRFATNPLRVANREALIPILAEVFRTRPRQHWIAQLGRAFVPAAAFTTFSEFRHHVHYVENEMFREFDSFWGRLCVGGIPWQFDRTPATLAPATQPGECTDTIVKGGWPAP